MHLQAKRLLLHAMGAMCRTPYHEARASSLRQCLSPASKANGYIGKCKPRSYRREWFGAVRGLSHLLYMLAPSVREAALSAGSTDVHAAFAASTTGRERISHPPLA